ncbi:hypothetical protein [Paenibacillus sp. NPDC058071]|uniref:hypothetical protein n=1 Tax=Paenibacillus sp. NPDC058071 TaxID=3346326 RepID=UPI0036D877BF
MINRRLPSAAPEHLVMLAAMECFTSCVLTYVQLLGEGRLLPMPDYWNLNYQFRTLLSSKDAKHFSLQFHYGIRMSFTRGDSERLRETIAGGQAAILLCSASRLAYFPRHMLGLETAGFQHSILISGWDEQAGSYRIADPMVGHVGEATPDEMELAGMRSGRQELNYFTLEPPEQDFCPPSAAEVFRYSSERNLKLFDLGAADPAAAAPSKAAGPVPQDDKRQAWAEWFGGRNGGSRAFEQCRSELAALPDWEPAAIKRWCDRNNLTVTSIWKVRQHVWDCFCRLGVMTEAETREAGDAVRRIVRRWQSFNYQLSRVKKLGAASPEDAAALGGMLAELCEEERYFLNWMNDLGQTVEARKEKIES